MNNGGGLYDDIDWTGDQWVVPKAQVVDLAVRLWVAFDERRKIINPVAGKSGRKNGKFFYRAAEFCLQRQIQPEVFAEVAIQRMATSGRIYPSMLVSSYVQGNAKLDAQDQGQEIAANYIAQSNLLRERVALYGLRHALEDRANGFSPLMIWMVARAYKLDDLTEPVRGAAKAEYLRYSTQKDIWGEVDFES